MTNLPNVEYNQNFQNNKNNINIQQTTSYYSVENRLSNNNQMYRQSYPIHNAILLNQRNQSTLHKSQFIQNSYSPQQVNEVVEIYCSKPKFTQQSHLSMSKTSKVKALPPEPVEEKKSFCFGWPSWIFIVVGLLLLIGLILGIVFFYLGTKNAKATDNTQNSTPKNSSVQTSSKPQNVSSNNTSHNNTNVNNQTQINECEKGYHLYEQKCITCPTNTNWNGTACYSTNQPANHLRRKVHAQKNDD